MPTPFRALSLGVHQAFDRQPRLLIGGAGLAGLMLAQATLALLRFGHL